MYFAWYFKQLDIRTVWTKPALLDTRALSLPTILTTKLPHEEGPGSTMPVILGFDSSSVMNIAGPLLVEGGGTRLAEGVFGKLEVLKCTARDLEICVPGRPVRDVRYFSSFPSLFSIFLTGKIYKQVILEGPTPLPLLRSTYIPTLLQTASPTGLRALSLHLPSTSPSFFVLLAQSFPGLEILQVLDDLKPVGHDGEFDLRDVGWDAENDARTALINAHNTPHRPLFTPHRLETLFYPLRTLRSITRITYSASYTRGPGGGMGNFSLMERFKWRDSETMRLRCFRVHHVELIQDVELDAEGEEVGGGERVWREVVYPGWKGRDEGAM